jgi:hypothetical protein
MTGNFLGSFLEGDLDSIGLFQTLFITLPGVPLAPKDVQQVYQLNWGVF